MKFSFYKLWNDYKVYCLAVCFLFTGVALRGQVTLPSVFTDNMVLQQKSNAPIWGKAAPGKQVTVTTSWDHKTYTVQASPEGKWMVRVKTPAASFTPQTITISDGTPVKLTNVLIGEVWICSGQSNMEMPLAGWGKVQNYEQEIANANYTNIRLLSLAKNCSTQPLEDAKLQNDGWKICSPSTIPDFSSVGYFFGRNLLQDLKIPIGLINTTWGGTIAEAWISPGTLENMPDFSKAVNDIRNTPETNQGPEMQGKLASWLKLLQSADKGLKEGNAAWVSPDLDDSDWKTMSVPGYWEEKALKDFDGVVWFRKTITIPAAWEGKDLKLNLGTIDDDDITYFNGEKIGATIGYNVPRTYTVPAHLVKSGKAVISVRVFDSGGEGGLYDETKNLFISLAGGETIALPGDWKYQVGVDLKSLPPMPVVTASNPNRPTVLFNAMINPLIPFAFRGVIWYQGESNADRSYQYREVFPLLISDWRKQWNQEFPFYFVQLANYMAVNEKPQESGWAELREAQFMTLHLAHTGMAVIIDIGDAKNIHPKNKQEVGRRLSLIARADAYGKKTPYSGPIYTGYQVENTQVRISFRHTDGGLKTNDGQPVKGFAVAGLDHVFHWADAKIAGNEVVVSSPEVPYPIAARYAWADNPVCNLYNGAGLPASPFRTDDWPGWTFGKK